MLHHRKIVADEDEGEPESVVAGPSAGSEFGCGSKRRGPRRAHRTTISLGSSAKRAGDGDALTLAAGEFVRKALGVLGRKPTVRRSSPTRVRRSAGVKVVQQQQRFGQDLADSHARIKRTVGILKDQLGTGARLPQLGVGKGGEVLTVETNGARSSARSAAGPGGPTVDLPQPDSPTSARVSPRSTLSRRHHRRRELRAGPDAEQRASHHEGLRRRRRARAAATSCRQAYPAGPSSSATR